MKLLPHAIIALPLCLMLGCAQLPEECQYVDIPQGRWAADAPADITLHIDDTASKRNVFFYVKHTTSYPNANLYLFLTIVAPNGATLHDTLNYQLATPMGEWLGRGFGAQRELRLIYLRETQFKSAGPHLFQIKHGMRYSILEGITAVGVESYPLN